MSSAEFEPVEVFDQLLAARSPRRRVDHHFRPVSLYVLAEQRKGVLARAVDFVAVHATVSNMEKKMRGLNAHRPATF